MKNNKIKSQSIFMFLILVQINSIYCRKVKLTDVQTLTLNKGRLTTSRRVDAIAQLKCKGDYCKNHSPDVVQCYNKGSDGIDVQWECHAQLEENFKFGKLNVICEGYDYADDPYILAGSCGLEYTLESKNSGHRSDVDYSKSTGSFLSKTFIFIVIGIVLLAIASSYFKSRPSYESDRVFPSAPPPPPPAYSQIYPNLNDFHSSSSPPPPGFKSDFGDTQFHRSENKDSNGNGWSNFIAGAALGSAGTYLWNRMSPSLNDPTTDDNFVSASHTRVSSPKKTATGFASTSRR